MEVELNLGPKFQSSIQKHAEDLLLSGKFSDIEIQVESCSARIQAHRIFLSLVCESYDLETLRVVNISRVSKEAVHAFMDLIYTGRTKCSKSKGKMIKDIFEQFGTWSKFKDNLNSIWESEKKSNKNLKGKTKQDSKIKKLKKSVIDPNNNLDCEPQKKEDSKLDVSLIESMKESFCSDFYEDVSSEEQNKGAEENYVGEALNRSLLTEKLKEVDSNPMEDENEEGKFEITSTFETYDYKDLEIGFESLQDFSETEKNSDISETGDPHLEDIVDYPELKENIDKNINNHNPESTKNEPNEKIKTVTSSKGRKTKKICYQKFGNEEETEKTIVKSKTKSRKRTLHKPNEISKCKIETEDPSTINLKGNPEEKVRKSWRVGDQIRLFDGKETDLSDIGYSCPINSCKKVLDRKKSIQKHFFNIHSEEKWTDHAELYTKIPFDKSQIKHDDPHPWIVLKVNRAIRKFGDPGIKYGKLFKCFACEAQPVSSFVQLKKHIEKYHDEDALRELGDLNKYPYFCHICFSSFDNSTRLAQHVFDVHEVLEQENEKIQCELCGNHFKTHKHLYNHERNIHTEKKLNFQCNICPQRFKSKNYRDNHVYKHTGMRPFACEKCDATFRRAEILKRHFLLKHTVDGRNKKCEHCGKGFTENSRLKQHIEVVHLKLKKHVCEICNWASSCNGNRRKHMWNIHKVRV